MKRFRLLVFGVTAPVAAGLLLSLGCSGQKEPSEAEVKTPEAKAEKKGRSTAAKTELASTGWGTLKGKVTFEGTPPTREKLSITKDQAVCEKGDILDQTWKVGGSDKGVANVVVWLRSPEGTYFKIPDDLKHKSEAVLDQPFCAFEPHVSVLYPSYFDGKKQERTGQELDIKNSAPMTHNTNYAAAENSDPTIVPSGNPMLSTHSDYKESKIKACKEKTCGGEQLMVLKCNIHTWMKGYAWTFDHPFAAVTSGDSKDAKEFGTYEIKQAPAGAEVELVYWHESMDKPKVLKKITLKDGDNPPVDFTISK